MSEGLQKWSEVGDEEAGAASKQPARRVLAPAVAIIVVACLGFAANCLVWFGLSAARQSMGKSPPPAGMDEHDRASYERGQEAAVFLDCCLVTLPTLAVYPLVLVGGIQMLRLRTRWLAITAGILAMLPCSPAFLLGLPLGVWALVVLLDPGVAAGFGRLDNASRRF
ncbi:MAG TPA: hypothetical protein VFA26_14480 [Gemmataceae bacterium]|nr:hypothetical protein [Gemmataceae bacterium]